MIVLIVIFILLLPGIVFFSNMISIEKIMWKNFDMGELKRPFWQVFNPINLVGICLYGYAWILSSTVRRSMISSILEQTKEKVGTDFEKCSRLRDVGLIIYDKFG